MVAEFVAGSGGFASGLAYRILEAGYRLQIPRMFAALVLLSLAGIAINFGLGAFASFVMRRRSPADKTAAEEASSSHERIMRKCRHSGNTSLEQAAINITNDIRTRIHVGTDRRITGIAPDDLPPGMREATITVTTSPVRKSSGKPFNVNDLPTVDLGPWPKGVSLRREDIYGDDGR